MLKDKKPSKGHLNSWAEIILFNFRYLFFLSVRLKTGQNIGALLNFYYTDSFFTS